MSNRPTVSVVMPFAGCSAAARASAAALGALHVRAGDQLILADNAGTALAGERGGNRAPAASEPAVVEVIRVPGERSPAHARNSGAERAGGEWILFLDADCLAPASLLDDFLRAPVPPEVGALAGGILPAPAGVTLAERYGAARNFLDARAHFTHPYLPRAAAANLMVRAGAFRDLGGFAEGVRAAEDTDLCWRLQRAGWRLELREQAAVEHAYRSTVGELRRQWRQYAAGRAWLARRYPDFRPQSAVARAIRSRDRRSAAVAGPPPRRNGPTRVPSARGDRMLFGALDLLLALEELRGLRESNLAGVGNR